MKKNNTEFLKRKSPLLYAALSFIMKRVEGIVTSAVIAGVTAGLAYWLAHHDTESAVQKVWNHSGIWVSNIETLQQDNQ
jgi:precorrin-2 methylase